MTNKFELAICDIGTNQEKARLRTLLEVALAIGRREGLLGNNGNKQKESKFEQGGIKCRSKEYPKA